MHTYIYCVSCFQPPTHPIWYGVTPQPQPHRKAIHRHIHRQIHLHTVYLHIHIMHTYMHMHPCMCIYIYIYWHISYNLYLHILIQFIILYIYMYIQSRTCIIWYHNMHNMTITISGGGPPDTGHCMGPRWSTKPSRTSSRSWRIGQRRCPCRRAVSVPWPHGARGGPPLRLWLFFSNVFNYTKKYV